MYKMNIFMEDLGGWTVYKFSHRFSVVIILLAYKSSSGLISSYLSVRIVTDALPALLLYVSADLKTDVNVCLL